MAIYTGFAPFYDRIMGDRSDEVARIRSYIGRYLPGARSLLELGCGDGKILKLAAATGVYAVGIELNPILVLIARLRTWRRRLVRSPPRAGKVSAPGRRPPEAASGTRPGTRW